MAPTNYYWMQTWRWPVWGQLFTTTNIATFLWPPILFSIYVSISINALRWCVFSLLGSLELLDKKSGIGAQLASMQGFETRLKTLEASLKALDSSVKVTSGLLKSFGNRLAKVESAGGGGSGKTPPSTVSMQWHAYPDPCALSRPPLSPRSTHTLRAYCRLVCTLAYIHI